MSLARPVATVGGATLLSRLLGFARDVTIAGLLGAGAAADAFFVALQLPNLARRLLGEGALNAALVPAYLRLREEGGEAAASRFAGRLGATMLALTAALALAAAAMMPLVIGLLAPGFDAERSRLAVDLARLMLPYLALAGPIAVLSGVLAAWNRFAAAGVATIAFNLTLIAALALLGAVAAATAAPMLAVAVAAAGAIQLLLLAAALRTGPARPTAWRPDFSAPMRRFLARAGLGLVAGGVPQLMLLAGVMAVSATPQAVSWLYYASRLAELPIGLISVAVGTVLVPATTAAVRANDRGALMATQSRALELALGLSLPAALGLAVLAAPIVRVLFERGAFAAADSAATAAALAALALGLPGHVLTRTLAPAFYARDDTATPMRAALLALAVAALGSLLSMLWLGHAGVALALALAGWVNAALLARRLARGIGFALDAEARRRLPRIVLAAAGMGLAVFAAEGAAASLLGQSATLRAVGLGGLIALGLAVYAALLRLFGVATLAGLRQALRKAPDRPA